MPAYKKGYANKFRPKTFLIERGKILLQEAMAKVKHQFLAILLTVCVSIAANAQYEVRYVYADSVASVPVLESKFSDRSSAEQYILQLPANLQAQGFITASIDEVIADSVSSIVHLYLGRQYKWATIQTRSQDTEILEAVRWKGSTFAGARTDFKKIKQLQDQILDILEQRGHPFAKVFLDSISIVENEIAALLKIEKGPVYKIDSIRVYGDIRIDQQFLQRYLDIPNGSIYNKTKLLQVDKKISDLVYIQPESPSNLSMLGSGAVLNLYLKQKRNNQVNALLGLQQPAAGALSNKVQLTGEANILLRNSLGAGETMGLNWQQLQYKSPRLTLIFSQPYFLKTKFGLDFNFNMLRKDTTFLNLDLRLGTRYSSGNQLATVYFQRRSTIVNGVNAAEIVSRRMLPSDVDVASNNLGLGYEFNNTDYRFNPRSGNELQVNTVTGRKTIRKNNQVLDLKDASDPSFNFERLYDTVKLKAFQVRATISASHYFPVGRLATFRTSLNGGIYESANIYRNELFQVGGYKLLRGFDEESEYLSKYLLGSVEYRYLLTRNSNFFAFIDGGFGSYREEHIYVSTGLGISFETKSGLINLTMANGKRDDVPFNLRQTKLHIGFTSYF